MIEHVTSSAGTLSQRTQIAASPDWQNLLTYFDLAGEGFAFIVMLVPDGEWAEACRLALERYLMAYRKKVVTMQFESAEEFGDELANRLLTLRVDEETGAVWVGAAVPEVSKDYKKWEAAWRVGVARLNQYRNPLREQFNVPLLFVGAPWIQTILREMAPDLWSVRTLVVRIEPSGSDSEIVDRSSSSLQNKTTWEEGRAIDPDFALKEAENLRRQPGKEIALSRLLGRAGKGFISRYRWDEAEHALEEAINLHRQFGEENEELADLLSDYAEVLNRKYAYNQAASTLSEALTLFQASGNMDGEANCLLDLGDLALQQSQYDEAQKYFELALKLFPLMGEILGEANCLDSLGNLATRRSQYDEAWKRYQEALVLYRQIGEVLGEANCIQSLGELALRRSQLDEAQTRYQEALALYRQIGEVFGEANCVKGLGNIALRRSQLDEAQTRYQEALLLYRQIGDVLGEANCILNLGLIALRQSEYDEAEKRVTEALPLFRQVGNMLGEANCIRSLGEIALSRLRYDEARSHFEAALPMYKQIGNLSGEANCLWGLADIALAKGEEVNAKNLFATALDLYEHLPEPYSIGWMNRQLARLATTEAERQQHIQAARVAWEGIGFIDLVKDLEEEFSLAR